MQSHVKKMWESLFSKPKRKSRPRARLGVELLEERCVPTVSATFSNVSDNPPSIPSGNTTTVTVTANDTTDAPITNLGSSDIVFGLGSNASGTSQGSFNVGTFTNVGNGVYTETLTGTSVGTANTITATIDGTLVSTAPSITVTASGTTSTVAVHSSSIASGASTTVTVTAEDASDNGVTGLAASDIVLSLGSAASGTSQGTFNAASFTPVGNGVYTETFTGTSVGTANTITATIDGTLVSTAPSITVTASGTTSTVAVSPASIPSGSTTTVTVTAEDASGNRVTGLAASDIALALGSAASGTSQGTFNAASFTAVGNGVYTETFTGTSVGTANTITATIDNTLLTTTPSITVTANGSTSTVSDSPGSIPSGRTTTVTVTAEDASGNRVTGLASSDIVFGLGSAASGTSQGTFNAASFTSVGNGVYTETFTGTTVGTPNTITATIDGALVSTAAPIAVTGTGVVSGSFLGDQAVDAAVTLKSTSGPAIPVALTTFTNASGSFTFSGLPAGTYEITTAPFAGRHMVGTISVGKVSTNAAGTLVSAPFTVSAGQTVVENIVVHGGLAPAGINLLSFLTSYAEPAPGSGNPNNKPIVSHAIANQTLSPTKASTNIDLAGSFTDADFTDTQVQFNITNGSTPETMDMTLFDAQAPATVANFLDYVNSGEYNNDVFSRLVTEGVASSAISVLQGGGMSLVSPTSTPPGLQLTESSPPTIPNEFSSANLNTAGTIAMAESSALNSGSDQFFFNTINNPSLNAPGTDNAQAFTVFGKLSNTSSTTALAALATTGVQDMNSAAGASAITAGGVDLTDLPLNNYTGSTTTFPGDTKTSNFMVINSIIVTKPDQEFLTYSVTSNSNPGLVTAAFLPNHPEQLALTYHSGIGTAKITVTATDRFGASTSQTFTVTVPNQAPTGTSKTVSTPEGTAYPFLTTDFGFTDPNTPPFTLNAVEITTLPTVGTLTDNGTAVKAGTFVSVADITGGKLKFTPKTGQTGSPYDSFTFQVQNNGGTADGGINTDPTAKTMTIDVT
jgi:cyclophilin family peptidyl-prolyl cis-trans isomerase